MARVTITLEQDERSALVALANQERRDPRQQAALILRRELERLGLLSGVEQQHGDLGGRVRRKTKQLQDQWEVVEAEEE